MKKVMYYSFSSQLSDAEEIRKRFVGELNGSFERYGPNNTELWKVVVDDDVSKGLTLRFGNPLEVEFALGEKAYLAGIEVTIRLVCFALLDEKWAVRYEVEGMNGKTVRTFQEELSKNP